MASPEAWIRATIEAESSVDAYPMVVPEGTVPPFIIYSRSSTARERALDGTLGAPAGQFDVDIYCDSYSAGKDLAALLVGSLVDFEGVANGVTILSTDITEESDGQPVFLDGRDVPTYVVSQSYLINWQE